MVPYVSLTKAVQVLIFGCVACVATIATANGSVLFISDSVGCGSSSPDGFSGSAQSGAFDALNGVQGIKLFGSCSAFFSAASDASALDLFASMAGGSGGPDVFPNDTIHIVWAFTPDSDQFSNIDWLVWVTIDGSQQQFGGTGFPGDVVTGEADVSVPQGGTLTDWQAGIGFSQAGRVGLDTNLTLTIPQNSLDVAPSPASNVPEPSTRIVALLSLAILGTRRRTIRWRLVLIRADVPNGERS